MRMSFSLMQTQTMCCTECGSVLHKAPGQAVDTDVQDNAAAITSEPTHIVKDRCPKCGNTYYPELRKPTPAKSRKKG